MDESREELHLLHLVLFTVGGLATSTGIILLAFSFGWPEGSLNSNFREVGFSGLNNIHVLQSAEWAIPLVVVGVCCLLLANATAWKETDGH